jgi:hypothetical protein
MILISMAFLVELQKHQEKKKLGKETATRMYNDSRKEMAKQEPGK